MRQPVLIDVQGAFSNPSDDELRLRHARYGQRVRDFTAGQVDSLLVLSKSIARTGHVIHERDGLNVISLGNDSNLISLGRTAANIARETLLPVTWIAGTPYREAIACKLANGLHPGRLQIQAHGDFGRIKFWGSSFSSKARRTLAAYTFRNADSVRCVSEQQMEAIATTYRLDLQKCFVAPVPILSSFLETTHQFPASHQESVGFVGRIHKERGLDLWIEIAGEVSRALPQAHFEVIGNGPDLDYFRRRLAWRVNPDHIHFRGELRGQNLVEAFSNLGVLLNTCKVEAYGRSMLEALSLGVKVVSVSSPGALTLADLFAEAGPSVRAENDLSSTVVSSLNSTKRGNLSEIRSKISALDNSSIDRLASSWLGNT